MSSMPTPVDTARRASSAQTGTARQSIVFPECRTPRCPVNPQPVGARPGTLPSSPCRHDAGTHPARISRYRDIRAPGVPLGVVVCRFEGADGADPLRHVTVWCLELASAGRAVYHRFSMIAPTASVKVSPAAIAAFAIIAPPAR